MRPLIFLDIDGVLNGHEAHANGYCGTGPGCVAAFNRVLAETDAAIVISSAWRYLVLSQYMTITGFENMLLTHGVDCRDRVRDITDPDIGDVTRGQQIVVWLRRKQYSGPYVVLDDDPDIIGSGHPFVRTDSRLGLTDADADRAIAILLGRDAIAVEVQP